jgi:hypothetical protein
MNGQPRNRLVTMLRNAQSATAGLLCQILLLSPAVAQNAPASAPVPGKSAAETPAAAFTTSILAGGGINTITVNVPMSRVSEQLHAEFKWKNTRNGKEVFSCTGPASSGDFTSDGMTKSERSEDVDGGGKRPVTIVTIMVPAPPCLWPPWQDATVVVRGKIRQEGGTTTEDKELLNGAVRISRFWFPLTIALLAVGLIYPGCALIAWYIKKRRYDRTPSRKPNDKPPDFWTSLDPVQITANTFGRASLGKLQIFGFSLLIFGLMLYYQLRTGILITLSTDILALLGISAVGATGGKLVQLAKRRLSFPNWAWLRRNGWLPTLSDDYAERARWQDLITDFDGKEFDVYSFQMGIFSLIVAVALIMSNLTGPEAFHIPAELLGLLGISQGVFIAGRAAGTSAYQDLDKMLDEVRNQSNAYFAAKAFEKEADRKTAEDKFREALRQAALMFWDVYGEQIGTDKKPAALAIGNIVEMTPEKAAAATGDITT